MNGRRIFLSPPWTGEEERAMVSKAFDSGYVAPCGPMVEAFEESLARLSGRRFAVAVSGGTAALDLAAAHLGIDRSWTVVAPSLTFVATVGPAWHRGARLVFLDSAEDGNVDCSLLDDALAEAARQTPGKVLFIGVDLYGRCCDYAAVSRICEERGALFIIDSAEAVGAESAGRPAGSAGVAGVYSFNGNKIATTSGGGALVTDDPSFAAHARSLSQQSRERFPWYEHREVGYNYRMSNIVAAIGIAQVGKLPEILRRRREIKERYLAIPGLRLLPPVPGENNWLSVALMPGMESRDALLDALGKADIEARPVWKPMHLQPVFKDCKVYGGEVSQRLFERGICLPSGSGLDDADFARIEETICTQLSRM